MRRSKATADTFSGSKRKAQPHCVLCISLSLTFSALLVGQPDGPGFSNLARDRAEPALLDAQDLAAWIDCILRNQLVELDRLPHIHNSFTGFALHPEVIRVEY
jgi:hypothetical protein